MTLVMGLDLSLTSPGLAFIEDGQIVHTANTKTTGKKQASLKYPQGATTQDRQQRIAHVRNWVLAEVEQVVVSAMSEVSLAVIEAPAVGSRLGSMHDRSGLWWQVVDALTDNGITVVEVSPAGRQKYITGTGKSGLGKDVVLVHAIHRYEDNAVAHNCAPIGKCDDIADAIGLADMGARRLGCPVVPDALMPVENLSAMDGVLWPS